MNQPLLASSATTAIVPSLMKRLLASSAAIKTVRLPLSGTGMILGVNVLRAPGCQTQRGPLFLVRIENSTAARAAMVVVVARRTMSATTSTMNHFIIASTNTPRY